MTRLERWSDPHRVAAVLGLAIATLVVLGVVFAWRSESMLSPFDLDGERNVPALFSALLLFVCAVLAFRLPLTVAPRAVALTFSGVLVLASLDEATEIHEKLEQRLDVDWQLLYIPVFVAAVVVWSLLVAGLRRNGFGVALVLASAGCWIASQVLEALQWEDEGPAQGYTWMMVVEETLEMAGSALLLVALLTVAQARHLDE